LASNSKSPFPFAVDNNINRVGNIIDRNRNSSFEFRVPTYIRKNKLAIQGNLFVDAGSGRVQEEI
jgi:hypothetical protein